MVNRGARIVRVIYLPLLDGTVSCAAHDSYCDVVRNGNN